MILLFLYFMTLNINYYCVVFLVYIIECDPPCVNGLCSGNRFEDVERTCQCFSRWTGSDCTDGINLDLK